MPERDGRLPVDTTDIDAAIAQVLQAERDAREEVQRCAHDAEVLLEKAQEGVRQVARRAAHRSVRVQRWSATSLQQQLEALAAQCSQAGQSSALADDPGQLRHAVEALAAQLTGGGR